MRTVVLLFPVHSIAPFVELHVQNAALSILVRQLMEVSNYFFDSFYPIIQHILYPFRPYKRSLLHTTPLLSSCPLPSVPFSQPSTPTLAEYQFLVDTWPFVEATLSNVLLSLPQSSRQPKGVVVDIGKAIVFTHKAEDASIPLGSFICKNKSWGEVMRAMDDRTEDDSWSNPVFRQIESADDTPLFPRFLVEAWSTHLYSTYSSQRIAHDLSFTLHFRPKVVLPVELFSAFESSESSTNGLSGLPSTNASESSLTTNAPTSLSNYPSESHLTHYPSESHLTHYPPELASERIPNALGLPLEVTFLTESLRLHLNQSHYRDILAFFFLNLGELPTVCCHPCFPACPLCQWSHDPGLRCADCWCVLKVVAERVKVRLFTSSVTNGTELGRFRCDALHFFSFLLNTSTKLLINIPTLFVSDTMNAVLYPQNGSSYQSRIPMNREYPLSTRMLLLKDEETTKGRTLELQLAYWLVNVRPLFFLRLYNWVCDPVWETADWPEAADWPKKVGNYDISMRECRSIVMNSTQSPEPNHHLFPAGLSLFNAFTNMNRECMVLGVELQAKCVLDAQLNTMKCEAELRCHSIVGTVLRSVFSACTNPTHFCVRGTYESVPCHNDPSIFDTTITGSIEDWSVALRVQDLPLFVAILSFQFQNTSKYLFTPATSVQEDSVIVVAWGVSNA